MILRNKMTGQIGLLCSDFDEVKVRVNKSTHHYYRYYANMDKLAKDWEEYGGEE